MHRFQRNDSDAKRTRNIALCVLNVTRKISYKLRENWDRNSLYRYRWSCVSRVFNTSLNYIFCFRLIYWYIIHCTSITCNYWVWLLIDRSLNITRKRRQSTIYEIKFDKQDRNSVNVLLGLSARCHYDVEFYFLIPANLWRTQGWDLIQRTKDITYETSCHCRIWTIIGKVMNIGISYERFNQKLYLNTARSFSARTLSPSYTYKWSQPHSVAKVSSRTRKTGGVGPSRGGVRSHVHWVLTL